jgi:hypothetical protein
MVKMSPGGLEPVPFLSRDSLLYQRSQARAGDNLATYNGFKLKGQRES